MLDPYLSSFNTGPELTLSAALPMQKGNEAALESVEETRLFSSSTGTPSFASQLPAGTGLDQLLAPFQAALNAATTLSAAQTVVRDFGQRLWQTATTRAATANKDDRPLYWARLQMMHALRLWQPGFAINFGQRQGLLDLFESASRGMESVSFGGTAGIKKILISGFDPFELDVDPEKKTNPSGAAVLALDGRQITRNGITAKVQGVIFPVRFDFFDEGKVENFFRPFLTGTDRVDMIMTISQGGRDFEVEEWAGRKRSSDPSLDNARRPGGGTPDIPKDPGRIGRGEEFLRTSLPKQEIRAELGRTGPIREIHEEMEFTEIPHGSKTPQPRNEEDSSVWKEPEAGSTAVEGSGGGFLSNEIFYRTRLLKVETKSPIPVGHLHIPKLGSKPRVPTPLNPQAQPWTRDAIVNQVQRILEATLPTLGREFK